MSTVDDILLEEDLICLRIWNNTDTVQIAERNMSAEAIQFHFVLKGSATFLFNNGNYKMPVNAEMGLILFNPEKGIPLCVELSPETWIVSVAVSVKKFHSLFSSEAEFIPFLNKESAGKKHYSQEPLSPALSVVLYQIMNYNLHSSMKKLYYTGKIYEVLSLLFNKPDENNNDACPFKSDSEDTSKIQKAKDILLENMAEPPTLQELSTAVGLNIKKLKEGFKSIYGDTVYGFLIDYKLEFARKLLDSGTYNVNEVGSKIGYSTASHFISAFKNKYGTTPKKYLTKHQTTAKN